MRRSFVAAVAGMTTMLSACGDSGSTPLPAPPPPPPANQAPAFTSAAAAQQPENLTTIFYRAVAADP